MRIRQFQKNKSCAGMSKYMIDKERRRQASNLPGSGRPFKTDEYPELTNAIFSMFESSSDGFSAHPRLICETLFLTQSTWMNGPRCWSFLTQVFGIDISLSTLYNYTSPGASKQATMQSSINDMLSVMPMASPTQCEPQGLQTKI